MLHHALQRCKMMFPNSSRRGSSPKAAEGKTLQPATAVGYFLWTKWLLRRVSLLQTVVVPWPDAVLCCPSTWISTAACTKPRPCGNNIVVLLHTFSRRFFCSVEVVFPQQPRKNFVFVVAGKDAKAQKALKAVKKGVWKKERKPRYSVVFHRPKTLKHTRDPKYPSRR
jgi:Ribosomal protein L23, N-terminal domain